MALQTAMVVGRAAKDVVARDIEHARNLLTRASDVQSAKKVMDLALAALIFARRQRLSQETQDVAHSLKVDAQRLLGEHLSQVAKHVGGRPRETGRVSGPVSVPTTLKKSGISKGVSSDSQFLAKLAKSHPSDYEEIRGGRQTIRAVRKDLHTRERIARHKRLPRGLPSVRNRYRLYHSAVGDLHRQVRAGSVDLIVTDPPYDARFLPAYTDLGAFAKHALKPGGSLVCLTGLAILPEVLTRLAASGLAYHWCLAYVSRRRRTPVYAARVRQFWKPLVWFTHGPYTGDYIRTDVLDVPADAGDKLIHPHGQSVAGMGKVIELFSVPGQTVCDPFCGGGAVGVAAVGSHRLFVGADIQDRWVAAAAKALPRVETG